MKAQGDGSNSKAQTAALDGLFLAFSSFLFISHWLTCTAKLPGPCELIRSGTRMSQRAAFSSPHFVAVNGSNL